MEIFRNKPVKHLRASYYDRTIDDALKSFDSLGTSVDMGTHYFTTETGKEVRDKIKTLRVSPSKGDTLYFGKTSKFPRFKLAESGFKRCIKVEKADKVVIGDIDPVYYTTSNIHILEDDMFFYFVTDVNLHRVTIKSDTLKASGEENGFKIISGIDYLHHGPLKEVYYGPVSRGSSKIGEDAINILENKYSKIVMDEDLGTAVNVELENLDESTIESIAEMLDSDDISIQGLGLKMLSGYNVMSAPLTVLCMLATRRRLSWLPEWKSVGVEQVKQDIGFHSFWRFPDYPFGVNSDTKYSDFDREMTKKMLKPWVEGVMRDIVYRMNTHTLCKAVGLETNYECK